MGRTSTARDRLVETAYELIHERGYAAIGVAEICARADVRKGSFYHFFESKQSLTLEAIDRHWGEQRAAWAAVLGGDGPALGRLERLMRSQVDGQRAGKRTFGMVRGCLFGNLAMELSNQDAVVRGHLAEVFAEQMELLRGVLAESVTEGDLPPGADSEENARALLAQLEGMVLFAKLADDPEVMDRLWSQAKRLIGAPAD